jgi:hypothetical protein
MTGSSTSAIATAGESNACIREPVGVLSAHSQTKSLLVERIVVELVASTFRWKAKFG